MEKGYKILNLGKVKRKLKKQKHYIFKLFSPFNLIKEEYLSHNMGFFL